MKPERHVEARWWRALTAKGRNWYLILESPWGWHGQTCNLGISSRFPVSKSRNLSKLQFAISENRAFTSTTGLCYIMKNLYNACKCQANTKASIDIVVMVLSSTYYRYSFIDDIFIILYNYIAIWHISSYLTLYYQDCIFHILKNKET